MKILILIIMAAITNMEAAVLDGDEAFLGVDTHLPAHKLAPGYAAGAVNKRFENGQAWPRYNVNRQGWGQRWENIVLESTWAASGYPINQNENGQFSYVLTGFEIGRNYYYDQGNSSSLNTAGIAAGEHDTFYYPDGDEMPTRFVATQATYYLFAPSTASGSAITAKVYAASRPKAFGRFNDPNGFDNLVLLTDEWRTDDGEDGGRGKAWRVISGNAPQSIPLNGHSIWDTARLIPCYNGLTAIRHGNERHYFSATRTVAITDTSATNDTLSCSTTDLATGYAVEVSGITGASGRYFVNVDSDGVIKLYDTAVNAIADGATGLFDVTEDDETGTLTKYNVDPTDGQIHLNCDQNWSDGDLVLFVALREFNSEIVGTNPPASNTRYWVKKISGNKVELYEEAALSSKLTMETSAIGRFYLERQASEPGFYGNGAPPLLMQPNADGNTAFEVGFETVPTQVDITATNATSKVMTVPNHRLLPGDGVVLVSGTITGWASGTKYVSVVNEHQVQLYDTQDNAIAGGATGLVALTDSETGTLKKLAASGVPMPPAREGIYSRNNRLILVSDKSNLAISDPLDPLHFTPYTAAVTANLGEADETRAVFPFGDDSILVLKERSILALNNFSGGSGQWTLTEVTRQYGCIAPLSVAQVGADVWAFSRQGVVSIAATIQGKIQGVAEPVSRAMKRYLDEVDWKYADQIVAAEWNNRFFIAYPRKGQAVGTSSTSSPIKNNALLVYNFLNRAWEGIWTGVALEVYAFQRHNVYGNERLCFVDYDGQVNFFGEGFTDVGVVPIEDELLTRLYTGAGALPSARKLWLKGAINWDTYKPTVTVEAVTPGHNESDTLLDAVAYDKTAYTVYGQDAYVAATATSETFNAANREDYSLSVAELTAGKLDVHQNISETVRMRMDDWGVQLKLSNTTGSCRVASTMVEGVAHGRIGSRGT